MLKVHENSGLSYDLGQLHFSVLAIQYVTTVTASGHELAQCCEILGRRPPNSNTYVFVGDNAREIVLNWQTQTKNTTN